MVQAPPAPPRPGVRNAAQLLPVVCRPRRPQLGPQRDLRPEPPVGPPAPPSPRAGPLKPGQADALGDPWPHGGRGRCEVPALHAGHPPMARGPLLVPSPYRDLTSQGPCPPAPRDGGSWGPHSTAPVILGTPRPGHWVVLPTPLLTAAPACHFPCSPRPYRHPFWPAGSPPAQSRHLPRPPHSRTASSSLCLSEPVAHSPGSPASAGRPGPQRTPGWPPAAPGPLMLCVDAPPCPLPAHGGTDTPASDPAPLWSTSRVPHIVLGWGRGA